MRLFPADPYIFYNEIGGTRRTSGEKHTSASDENGVWSAWGRRARSSPKRAYPSAYYVAVAKSAVFAVDGRRRTRNSRLGRLRCRMFDNRNERGRGTAAGEAVT